MPNLKGRRAEFSALRQVAFLLYLRDHCAEPHCMSSPPIRESQLREPMPPNSSRLAITPPGRFFR